MKRLFIPFFIILCFYSNAHAGSYHSMGRAAYVHKNYEKAREMFLKDIEKNETGDSYYFLGEIEKNDKNYDLAITYFQGATERRTTRKYLVNAYWNLIILHEEKGDYGSVVKYCRQMWHKTGDSSARKKIESLTNKLLWTNNEEAISRYNSGMDSLKKGNRDEAMRFFREALSFDSSFLAPRFELGMAAYNSGNDSDALYYLQPITERIPYYTEVQLIVANINFNNRNYYRAAVNYSSIIEYGFSDSHTESDARLKRGICYYNTGDLDRAEEDIASVAESIRKDPEPLIILSAIYIKKKKLDEALKVLARAESISPDDPVVLYQIGSIYYFREDWKYLSYFDRLHDITLKKNSDEYSKYIKAYKIAISAHYDKKNYQRVVEMSEPLLQQTNDYDIILLSGKSLCHTGRYDSALERLDKISLRLNDQVYLALANVKTGRREKAKEILKRIITDREIRIEAMKDRDLRSCVEEIEKEYEEARERQAEQNSGQENSGGNGNTIQ